MSLKNVVITELINREEWTKAFPIMKQLRTNLTEEKYLGLLSEMMKDGYRLFGLKVNHEIVAVCGLALRVNFYSDRHVFIYDLVTDIKHRSLGMGEILIEFVHNWAKENGTKYVALESGIQRTAAHRFYEEKLNYDKWCFSFRKEV